MCNSIDCRNRAYCTGADKDIRKVDGIILGSSIEEEKIISLPKDSRLNRNFAVCGSQGSIKSRTFARNMILQCVKRGESMFITDLKSELYEDTAYNLKQNGYLVKQYNLIHHDCSDSWDCLAEFAKAYRLLLNNSLEKLDAIFENLPIEHPTRGPYQLFAKAEKVKENRSGVAGEAEVCLFLYYLRSGFHL